MQKFKCNKNHLVLRIANNTTIALRKKRIKRKFGDNFSWSIRWSFDPQTNKHFYDFAEMEMRAVSWSSLQSGLWRKSIETCSWEPSAQVLVTSGGGTRGRRWKSQRISAGRNMWQVNVWKSKVELWWLVLFLVVGPWYGPYGDLFLLAHMVTFFLLAHLVTYLVNSWPPAFIFTGHGLARLGL